MLFSAFKVGTQAKWGPYWVVEPAPHEWSGMTQIGEIWVKTTQELVWDTFRHDLGVFWAKYFLPFFRVFGVWTRLLAHPTFLGKIFFVSIWPYVPGQNSKLEPLGQKTCQNHVSDSLKGQIFTFKFWTFLRSLYGAKIQAKNFALGARPPKMSKTALNLSDDLTTAYRPQKNSLNRISKESQKFDF